MKNESMSISFPGGFLELVDAFTANRSQSCVAGLRKQMIMKAKLGDLFALMNESMGTDIKGPKDLVEMSVKIPKDLLPLLEKHCWDCGYDRESFFLVAAVKFLLMKEQPAELWEAAERSGREGINPFGGIVR